MDDIDLGETATISRVYRLYPNATQLKKMEHYLAGCRRTYNHLLEINRNCIENGWNVPSEWDMRREASLYRHANPEFEDVHSSCVRQTSMRVKRAIDNYLKCKQEGKDIGLPRFKSFRRYHSFTFEGDNSFRFYGDRLRLGNIGKVRYRNDIHPKGTRQACIVRKDASGKWYATIYYRVQKTVDGDARMDNLRKPVGVDLGIKNAAVLSDGRVYEGFHFYRDNEEKIAKMQRSIAFREKNGEDVQERRRRLYALEMKISRRRKAYCRRVANDIVEDSLVIILERLNIREMIQRDDHGHNLNKQFMDASMGMLRNMIRCKAEGAGIPVIEINPMYTSRKCSNCGYVFEKLRLKDRKLKCPMCDVVIDRDFNAAVNILNAGLDMETFLRENGRAEPDNIPIVL